MPAAVRSIPSSDLTAIEISGRIVGEGGLTIAAPGQDEDGETKVILSNDNTYTGGTTITGGRVQIGRGGTSGSIVGDVVNHGVLVFRRSDTQTFSGRISGSGSVVYGGAGTTILSGRSTYSGDTHVSNAALRAGGANVFSGNSKQLVFGTLDLADFDQTVAGLTNSGTVSLGHVSGTRLTVAGDYVGEGGVLHFTTELAGDASRTDRLTVEGDTSGTGVVEVANDGGGGAQTVNGIKIIDVEGASNASFTLAGDAVVDGRPVVVAGAFAYSLWKNGVDDPADGDWYLRSQVNAEPSAPGPSRGRSPGRSRPAAGPARGAALRGLSAGAAGAQRPADDAGADRQPLLEGRHPPGGGRRGRGRRCPRAAWSRTAAPGRGSRAHGSASSPTSSSATGPEYDMDVWKLQVGIDRPVRETGRRHRSIAGLTFSYGTVDTDVSSGSGDGGIATDGYGLGGTLTWLRDDDLYVDGQAQLMWYDSDLSSDEIDEDLASGNDGFGYALGVEVGKRMPLKPAWTVTPQAQLDLFLGRLRQLHRPVRRGGRRRRGREHAGPARRVARSGERLEGARAATGGGRTSTASPTSTTTWSRTPR